MEENSKNYNSMPIKELFSDTIIIALITGTAYIASYFYQNNYLEYFNIPDLFIDINIRSIIFVSLIELLLLIFLVIIYNFYKNWKPYKKILMIFKSIIIGIVILTFIAIPYYFTILQFEKPIYSWLCLILILISIAGTIYQINSNSKNNLHTPSNKNDFLSRIRRLYGLHPILFVTLCAIFLMYSATLGFISPKVKSEYLVSNTNPKLVIISTYLDSFVCLTFNVETKEFNKDITILSKEKISQDGITFTSQNIGPLKPMLKD